MILIMMGYVTGPNFRYKCDGCTHDGAHMARLNTLLRGRRNRERHRDRDRERVRESNDGPTCGATCTFHVHLCPVT